jgi:amidophosphoribosyltransferase
MVLGQKPSATGSGIDYMMASESVALVQCGYTQFVDVLPGQAVIIEKGKKPQFQQVQEQLAYSPDIFEYVYFARPDTVIDGIDVDEARQSMGSKLAETIRKQLGPAGLKEIDVVMPIPETSITSAQCVAASLGKPYVQGFVRNRYIFRTFIMPNQKARQKGVRAKLNAMPAKFAGKNVLLVDDSIVRGTTSREIVLMAREAGAKKVFFTSCAPPITNAHIYGIDLASSSELLAHHRSSSDIAQVIGADGVIYQTLPDLETACLSLAKPNGPNRFEVGVFCGKYVTPVDNSYFEHLERIRGDRRKAKVVETARRAVVAGLAGEKDIKIAQNGAEVDPSGNVVPADHSPSPNSIAGVKVNGNDISEAVERDRLDREAEDEKARAAAQHANVGSSQDISLHNLNDDHGDFM